MKKIILLVLACAAASAATSVFAQAPGGMRRIGILSASSVGDQAARAQFRVFTERLRELGYVEGRTIVIERAYAGGRYDRLGLLAGDLVKAKVEVIVTDGSPATAAAKRATATVPIVATTMNDPVASGFAASLAHPGRNVTGFPIMGSVVYEKRLELLAEAVPAATRIGVLANPDSSFYVRVLPGLQAAAQRLGRELVLIKARDTRGIQDGFALLRMRHAGALFVVDDPFLDSQSGAIADLALRDKVASIFPLARAAKNGGLIGYANDARQRYRSTADYVDRILKGEKAGDLPIEPPLKFELSLNLKTAAELGIAIPPPVRARADQVIE
jgi:putative ABC transport system substrate-binding protein